MSSVHQGGLFSVFSVPSGGSNLMPPEPLIPAVRGRGVTLSVRVLTQGANQSEQWLAFWVQGVGSTVSLGKDLRIGCDGKNSVDWTGNLYIGCCENVYQV